MPRMRICWPEPTVPEVGITTTPGARPFTSACIETMGCVSVSDDASTLLIELPISRFCAVPAVPVTTTASRLAALADIWMRTF